MRELKFRVWSGSRMILDSGLSIKGNTILTVGNSIPMQFTGLKDKNGNDIYEGDIIFDKTTEDYYVVEIIDDRTIFCFKNIISCDKVTLGRFSFFIENLDIIGNIYEDFNILKDIRVNGKNKKSIEEKKYYDNQKSQEVKRAEKDEIHKSEILKTVESIKENDK